MSMINAMNRIEREAGVKRCIIIEGNINDVILCDRQIQNIKNAVHAILEKKSYKEIVTWDRISGIQGDISKLNVTEDVKHADGDEVADIDGLEIPSQELTPGSCKSPCDMFNIIFRTMSDPKKHTAFILDWSDYLFTRNGNLDVDDREYLTLLGKSLRELEPDINRRSIVSSTVIILTTKSSYIPISAYSNNPEVSIITLSKPDIEERRNMLKKAATGFNLDGIDDISVSSRFEDYVNLLNDFTNREIIQMANMSQNEEKMSFEKLFYLFKYGEKENPWEKLNQDKLRHMGTQLKKRVVGQDCAVERVRKTIIKAFMGITGIHKASSKMMPKGVFFFVGPTGVGKTELSKALAEFLFGEETACIRFDMSEYAQPNSDQKLIGAPPGYVGYEEGGQLTNAIREKPFSVILFDEIEKAAKPNPRILDIFLQILEDGRLTDGRGETVYFTDSVIIFTSNLGTSEIKDIGDNDKTAEQFTNKVKEYFNNELKRPEILGRIGYENIIPFNFINNAAFAEKIIDSKMKPINEAVHEKYGITLTIKDPNSFFKYILGDWDPSKGGRDVLNALDSKLLTPLGLYLFEAYDLLEDLKGKTLIISISEEKNAIKFNVIE